MRTKSNGNAQKMEISESEMEKTETKQIYTNEMEWKHSQNGDF